MSRRKPVMLLIIAAVLGLLATTATARFLEGQGGLGSGKTVLVAAEDLSPGTRVTEENVEEMPWLRKTMPDSLITELDSVVDLYVSSPITKGEPLIRNKLSADYLAGKIAEYVPLGYRAMAITVDSAVRVGGLLEPGSLVDVLTVMNERGSTPVSKIILQNIKVLSVGVRKTDDEEEEDRRRPAVASGADEVITLLLRPGEAEKLTLAMTKGKIQVIARGRYDTEHVSTDGFSAAAFLPRKKELEKPVEVQALPMAAEPPKPEYTADTLFNRAQMLEAKGELEAARKTYNQISEKFPDDKLAAEAVGRAGRIAAKMEENLKMSRVEKALAAAKELLNKGMFDECRKRVRLIVEEFGSLTYRGD